MLTFTLHNQKAESIEENAVPYGDISQVDSKRSIAGTYPSYPNFFIITSTSWKIRAKNPNIREVDYGDTTCYSGKAACDLDRDYSGMQEQRHENKGLAC